MGFKQFLLILRRRWLSVVLVFLVGIGTNVGVSLTSTPVYESSAKMFLAINVADADQPAGRDPLPRLQRAVLRRPR